MITRALALLFIFTLPAFAQVNNIVAPGGTLTLKTNVTVTGSLTVTNHAYDATTWNGNLTVATKDAIRDKFESLTFGTGDALVANPLSQFASTTSLQLSGVISDEVGTGSALFGNQAVSTGSSPTFVGMTLSGTGALQFPSGTTAQQPANAAGLIRWNTDTARFEHNIGTGWKSFVRLDGDTMTGELDIYLNSSTIIPGLVLSNTAPASLGAQKISPALFLSGNGWSTTSSASQPVAFRITALPVQGATTPTSGLQIDSSLNNGTYTTPLSLTSAGHLTVLGNIVAGTAFQIYFLNRSVLSSSVDGAMEMKNFGGTARATLQANQPQITKTANYVIVALDSGLRFVNIGAAATNRFDLPTAAAGMHFWFYEDAAFTMRVQATGTDVIRDAATVSPTAGGISLDAVGTTLHIFSPKALLWVVDSKNGTFLGPN